MPIVIEGTDNEGKRMLIQFELDQERADNSNMLRAQAALCRALVDELNGCNPDNMSPLECLTKLYDLKRMTPANINALSALAEAAVAREHYGH